MSPESVPVAVGDGLTRRDRYALQTRGDLLAAAAACFCEQGYAATSLSDISRRAQVTRGAVYHHFANKQALFEEVLVDQLSAGVASLQRAADGGEPVERAASTLVAFLELCAREPFRTLVLEQGPVALGWRRWRELDEAYTVQLLTEHLQALAGADVVAVPVTDILVRLLYACLHEAADLVAHAAPADRDAVRAEAVGLVLRFLAALGPDPAIGQT